MKKKIVALMMAGLMAFAMTACGNTESKPKEDPKTTQDAPTEDIKEKVTYQTILDEYTQKIADTTPGLVEEYNTESASVAGDINALAELSNSKIEKLAEISNEGIQKMAELMYANSDEYSVYEEWSLKLTDVYTQYSTQITDAYTASASNMSTEDLMNSLENMQ